MKRSAKLLTGLVFTLSAMGASAAASAAEILVHKSPYCGCCSEWVKHMEAAGFDVTVKNHDNMDPIKRKYGIQPKTASCHTAVVDGYVLEGHVPLDAVQRLLKEQPNFAGLAVPGMPAGSLGMEMGDRKDPYDVLAFNKMGATRVYSEHNK